ncbi:hypothetical protein L210DRAFT_864530, partial [Boletus edulis BED1]
LQKTNPTIDWAHQTISIPESSNESSELYQTCLVVSHFIPLGSPIITKLTNATELAMAAEKAKPIVSLPPEYKDYSSVFSKETADHLPPSCPYDHEINLDHSFTGHNAL